MSENEPRHFCHARGCGREVPPKLLMCPQHWRMVPFRLQKAVYATYRPGQEVTKMPSAAYLLAAREAIEAVAQIENPELLFLVTKLSHFPATLEKPKQKE